MSERDERSREPAEPGREPAERLDERPEEVAPGRRKPAPGIEHEPEPDGENLIPAKDRPGTF